MISVSRRYKELMRAESRPPCLASVRIEGYWQDGEVHVTTFPASVIKKIQYDRSIDPTGDSFSYINLTFTTLYTGEFNEYGEPSEFVGMIPRLAVTVTFEQELPNGNTESISLPIVFLNGMPKREGMVLRWTASDILSHMTNEIIRSYDKPAVLESVFANIALEARTIDTKAIGKVTVNDDDEEPSFPSYIGSLEISAANAYAAEIHETLNERILAVGKVNDLLKDLLAAHTRYIDFDLNGALAVKRPYTDFVESGVDFSYMQELQEPTISVSGEISGYNYTRHQYYYSPPIREAGTDEQGQPFFTFDAMSKEIQQDSVEFLEGKSLYDPDEDYTYTDSNLVIYKYVFPSAGVAVSRRIGDVTELYDRSVDADSMKPYYEPIYYQTAGEGFVVFDIGSSRTFPTNHAVIFCPFEDENQKRTVTFGNIGDSITEENPFQVYEETSIKTVRRYNFLRKFGSRKRSISFIVHGNLSVETGDIIGVQVDRAEDYVDCVVTDERFEYNGKLICQITAREV